MKIRFDSTRRIFSFDSSEMSYAVGITDDGRLANLYWGASVKDAGDYDGIR